MMNHDGSSSGSPRLADGPFATYGRLVCDLRTACPCLADDSSARRGQSTDDGKTSLKGSNGHDIADERARLTVFLPDAAVATGRIVIVCPGGAYGKLAIGHEGTDWAPFFNQMGIALAVLAYRLPHGHPEVPVSDAEEAMRLVRRHAAEWHVDSRQVGLMGFSAGAHLVSYVATQSVMELRPDFHILFYPVITMNPACCHGLSMENLLGSQPTEEQVKLFSTDLHVNSSVSRVFMAFSEDDGLVSPSVNAVRYQAQCAKAGVPVTVCAYSTGGHGWGLRSSFAFHDDMLRSLKAWLQSF